MKLAAVLPLLAALAAAAQDAAPSLPLRFDRNGIPMATVEFNGQPLEAGIDTGAAMTVLSESSAKRIGVRELGPASMPVMDPLGHPIEAQIGAVDVDVAGMKLVALPVLVIADERLQARVFTFQLFRFDALLGWNAMARARVTIDYGARELRFDAPARDCSEANLWTRNSLPYVRYEANGATAEVLVDTGARTSVLVTALPPQEGENTRLVAGAGGVAMRREGVRSGLTFTTGGQRWDNLTLPLVQASEHDVHGALIGNDLLAGRRVELDATCGRFSVGPKRPR